MTETPSEMHLGTWQVPECPFSIVYAAAVLEEIRLAVVDAFYSVPRGGAEIGGLLYGQHDGGQVRILAFRPMECEHATGPSFVLSINDRARLSAGLEEGASDPVLRGLDVVGWYHSHTRSEIFLSEQDLEIYDHYFPQAWQVALVLRPSGTKPTRAGFFFREEGGRINSSESYREFLLAAPAAAAKDNGAPGRAEAARRPAAPAVTYARSAQMPLPPMPPAPVTPVVPPAVEQAASPPAPPPPDASLPSAAMVLQQAAPAPVEQEAPVELVPVDVATPAFAIQAEEPRRARWPWVALALLLAAGAAGYFTKDYWIDTLRPKPPALRLEARDTAGQLRIQWDRAALGSQDVQGGRLEIADGTLKTVIPLDAPKVRAGSLQYARVSDIVEVHMIVDLPRQRKIEEYTSFVGQPGAPKGSGQEAASPPQPQPRQTELAAEAERARGDLKKEEQRSQQLERSLEEMRRLLREEGQRKRAENQLPNPIVSPPPPSAAKPPARTSNPPSQPAASPAVTAAAAATNPGAVTPAPKPPVPKPTVQEKAAEKPPERPPERQPERPAQVAQNSPPPRPPVTQPAVRPPATQPERPAVETAAPARAPSAPPVVNRPQAPASTGPSLSGRWVFSPATRTGSPFQPESVTIVLTEAYGQVRGVLSGRYKVPRSRKFNPNVTFNFEGPLRAGSSKFTFATADGMKGEIELIPLPSKQNEIEVVWYSERDKLTFDDMFFRVP